MVVTNTSGNDRFATGWAWGQAPATQGDRRATVIPPTTEFEMARVFGRTFEVSGRNWALYLALSVVLVGLPTLIFQLLMPSPGNPDELVRLFQSPGGLRHYFTILGIGGVISTLFSV